MGASGLDSSSGTGRGGFDHHGGRPRRIRFGVLALVGIVAGSMVGAVVYPVLAGATASTTTTTQASAATITLSPTGSITDNATVQGNPTSGSPTGTVKFYICQTSTSQTLSTGSCAAVAGNIVNIAHLTAGSGNASGATSASFTPKSAGTWCFSAVYSGDVNYSSSSDNTSSGNLDTNECTLVNRAPSISHSTGLSDHITLGSGSVTDEVDVLGNSQIATPTGTAVFYVCETGTVESPTTAPCPSTGTPEDPGETLGNGASGSASATSVPFTPTSAGEYCFSVAYGGDVNYAPSADNTTAGNADANECFLVSQASSATASTISTGSITLGPSGSVTDSVTVTGNAAGGSPTGSVDFYACQTGTSQTLTTGSCAASGTPEDAGVGVTGGSNDTSSAISTSFTPASAGTWCFSAAYGGDSNYLSSSDNTGSGNLDTNECVLVGVDSDTTASTISTGNITLGPSGTVTDSVTVTGNATAGPPTGSVDFYACQTGTSQTLTTGSCAASGTPEDAGAGLTGASGDSSTANSTTFTPSAAGTWCFSAAYGGDDNYSASSDNTGAGNLDAAECVLVAPASSTTSTNISSADITVGPSGNVSDLVTVAGDSAGGAPAGNVDFYVCQSAGNADALCSSTANPEGTPALTAAGSDTSTATSQTFTPSAEGVYCFAAVYVPASNSNYTGSSDNVSGTVDPNECVSVTPAQYTFISPSSASATAGDLFLFAVQTYGTPTATKITKKGRLPKGLHFTNFHNGSAGITGTPSAKKLGPFHLTFTATFGKGKTKHVATQAFTLTITAG